MPDQFLLGLIQKYSRGTQHTYLVNSAKDELDKLIKNWAGNCLISTTVSGSFAKGTAISLGSDFDLFVSLDTSSTLKEVYYSLFSALSSAGYVVKKQNVSLGAVVNNLNVDVIPAKKQPGHTNDHSLYLSKSDSWTQTNVEQHISLVRNSGRLDEIRITKIWSKLHKLEFPSFYLELAVIEALKGRPSNQLDLNFQKVLSYLSTAFKDQRFVDPANSNNIISDLLTNSEKDAIAAKAKEGYDAANWSGVIW